MTHPVSAAITAFLDRCRVAPALVGVRLFDGPPVEGIEDLDVLAFGLSAVDAAGAVGDVTRGWGGQQTHSFDIAGLLQSWSGDTDVPGLRDHAFALLDGVAAVLAADETLGGACDRARLGRWTYRALQAPRGGALALIDFTVRVDTRRFEGF